MIRGDKMLRCKIIPTSIVNILTDCKPKHNQVSTLPTVSHPEPKQP